MARNGYQVMFLGALPSGHWVDVTLYKHADPRGNPEYRVLTTTEASTMENELNDAAGEGFRLVYGGVFAKPTAMHGLEFAAVMEQVPAPVKTHQYLVLTTMRASTLENEIADAEAHEYEVVAYLNSGKGHVAFLERP